MFIAISPTDPTPLYQQIIEQLKDAIAKGRLIPHEKLPSIREMAVELNTSQITTKRAYADLENEGYIYTRSGLGSFVAELNRTQLKADKLAKLKNDLNILVARSEKFGISRQEIASLILENEEGE